LCRGLRNWYPPAICYQAAWPSHIAEADKRQLTASGEGRGEGEWEVGRACPALPPPTRTAMEPIVGDQGSPTGLQSHRDNDSHATIAVADADQGSPSGLAAGALFPGSPFPQSYLLGASGMVTPQSALAGRSRSSSAVLEPGVGTAPDDGSNPFEGDVLGPASLAGRKRSQPTGGWGWPDDGAVQDCGSNGPQEGVPRKGADHATATCDTAEIRFATGGEAAGTAGVSGEGAAEGAAEA